MAGIARIGTINPYPKKAQPFRYLILPLLLALPLGCATDQQAKTSEEPEPQVERSELKTAAAQPEQIVLPKQVEEARHEEPAPPEEPAVAPSNEPEPAPTEAPAAAPAEAVTPAPESAPASHDEAADSKPAAVAPAHRFHLHRAHRARPAAHATKPTPHHAAKPTPHHAAKPTPPAHAAKPTPHAAPAASPHPAPAAQAEPAPEPLPTGSKAEKIAKIMRKHRRELLGCGYPYVCKHWAVIHFAIYANGRTKLVTVKTGDAASPPDLTRCLTRQFANIRFPPLKDLGLQPAAGNRISATYPLQAHCADK